jgi:hypothetical protein
MFSPPLPSCPTCFIANSLRRLSCLVRSDHLVGSLDCHPQSGLYVYCDPGIGPGELWITFRQDAQALLTSMVKVFFGTPHRATEAESWESIAMRLMLMTQNGYNYRISKVIEQTSRTLMEVNKDFQIAARIYGIICFFEKPKDSASASLVRSWLFSFFTSN